ncbi:MAG: tripartite tricarboxylate transporter TctB family protein [Chloroflexi bacterium]|nr:tripartite tricarboxylate transporter TctB family protein [Chloroflexota bacterium]
MKHDFLVAICVVLFAIAYLIGALMINEPNTSYSAVGPRFLPIFIGVGMFLSGVWLGWQAWRKKSDAKIDALEEMEWRTWGACVIVLLGYILAFETVGYLITTSVFLFLQARVFGSRAWLRDLVVSVALTALVYFFFNGLLKVGLPKGILG